MMEVRVGTSDKFKLHLNSTSFRPFSVIITALMGMKCGDIGEKMISTENIFAYNA